MPEIIPFPRPKASQPTRSPIRGLGAGMLVLLLGLQIPKAGPFFTGLHYVLTIIGLVVSIPCFLLLVGLEREREKAEAERQEKNTPDS